MFKILVNMAVFSNILKFKVLKNISKCAVILYFISNDFISDQFTIYPSIYTFIQLVSRR